MIERGELEKLVVRAYREADFAESGFLGVFEAYVNPNEITQSYEMEYNTAQGAGTTGGRMDFNRVKPGDLSLAFFLDGTGANGRPLDVQAKVDEFREVTGYNGEIHRTNYLKIAWGNIQVKRCVLKSASVAYKLFRSDGVPLRAVITASFSDACDDKTRVAMARDSSPDLTHMRILKDGDSLAAMCEEIYGDPALALKVARANGLDGFRHIAAGSRIVFPPLEK